MKFAPPPIRTPFEIPGGSGDPIINRVWLEWFQDISIALSSTTAVTGAKGGNAALASLIANLAAKGIIEDQTS